LFALRVAVGEYGIGLCLIPGGVGWRPHPVLRLQPPAAAVDALRPYRTQLQTYLTHDVAQALFGLPPGPLHPSLVALLIWYDVERQAFAPAERQAYRRAMTFERERGAPEWYAEIAAIETVLAARTAARREAAR
jgi:hypothetical protein